MQKAGDKKTPLVSVIIPNYNYGRFLTQTIDSVLAQTYPNIEIILVDDGSTDDSLLILDKYSGRIKILTQKNKGVGAARNYAAAHSSGELFAFLDADDFWQTNKIEIQVAAFAENDEVGLITSAMREFDTNTGETILDYMGGESGWRANELLLHKPVVVGPGSTGIVKAELFRKVGGFDERKEMHPVEDWEFCYRVARISQIAFIPQMLVEYRNHGTNGHLQIPRMERALLLAYDKIFSEIETDNVSLKKLCYGKVHSVLAGSYFRARQYKSFLRHAAKSLWLAPPGLPQFIGFPVRVLHKRSEKK